MTFGNRITVVIGAAVVAWLLALPAGLFASAAPTVGVPDFATRPSLPNISGFFPGRFSADSATTLLEGTGHPPLTVIARTTITQAQSAMGWRTSDITVLARLKELADRAGAAHLVVGTVDGLGTERSGNIFRSRATVTVQVFTAQPTRITSAVTGAGMGAASARTRAAEQALQRAVEQALQAARAAGSLGP